MKKKTLLITLLAGIFSITALAQASGPSRNSAGNTDASFMQKFTDGLYSRNRMQMISVVKENKTEIPAKVDNILDETLTSEVPVEEKKARFYVLERLANEYKYVTGDSTVLANVKKRVFEDKLTRPTSPEKKGPVYVIEGVKTETARDIFLPDNIVIKAGDTIRWVNNGHRAQMLTSVMTTIGRKGIESPMIEPGQSWEHTFYAPGDYYYISPLHEEMYGKIVVER